MVPGYKKVRLKFKKVGNAKFISHLDLDRTMKSVLTRSGVKVEHTHGYNPRPYLVFSLPTSVGTESLCEYLDINAEQSTDVSMIRERLNKNLPPDIEVTDVYVPEEEFKRIAWSEYELCIVSPCVTEELVEKVNDLFTKPVYVEKRTKKTESGFMDFDISPYIKKLDAAFVQQGKMAISTTVSASVATYINPEYIIKAICKYLSLDLNDPKTCLYTILRTCVYKENGEVFR